MPTPPPLCTATRSAPAAVFTSAFRMGQSAIASLPSRMPSVSRYGDATDPASRWSRVTTIGPWSVLSFTILLMIEPNFARSP